MRFGIRLCVVLACAFAAPLSSRSTNLAFGSISVSSTNTQNVTPTNSGSSSVTISNVVVAAAGFNASGAQQRETYDFVVTAVHSQGEESAYSVQVPAAIS